MFIKGRPKKNNSMILSDFGMVSNAVMAVVVVDVVAAWLEQRHGTFNHEEEEGDSCEEEVGK